MCTSVAALSGGTSETCGNSPFTHTNHKSVLVLVEMVFVTGPLTTARTANGTSVIVVPILASLRRT